MGYKEVLRVDISEVIRRWQAGNSRCHIASGTGLSKDTVGRYISAAEALEMSREGPAPTEEQLSRLAAIGRSGPRQSAVPTEDKLALWADQVYQWLTGDRLQVTRVQELLAERGCPVSYASLHRFVARRNWRGRSRSTVRMEDTAPGEVAELDFGRLGLVPDPETGRRRTVWALIVVLAYSRHSFVWPTFSQKLEDVIAGLEAAWSFFGGIPRYLVMDNFPAAVAGADALHPRFPGILPAPRLHLRPGQGAPSQGQARGGAQRPVPSGAFLQRRQLQRPGTLERGIGALVSRCRRAASARHHQASAPGCLQRGGATYSPALGRRALRDHPLADRQGASRSPRGLPVRPLFGTGGALPSWAAGGDRPGQQAGPHLPQGAAGQAPPPSGTRRPLHRPTGLPERVDRLHPARPGPHQAQRGGAWTGRGRLRRASL